MGRYGLFAKLASGHPGLTAASAGAFIVATGFLTWAMVWWMALQVAQYAVH